MVLRKFNKGLAMSHNADRAFKRGEKPLVLWQVETGKTPDELLKFLEPTVHHHIGRKTASKKFRGMYDYTQELVMFYRIDENKKRIAELEKRLEIYEKPTMPDGIDCRDTTIKGLREVIDNQHDRIVELEDGLRKYVTLIL